MGKKFSTVKYRGGKGRMERGEGEGRMEVKHLPFQDVKVLNSRFKEKVLRELLCALEKAQ